MKKRMLVAVVFLCAVIGCASEPAVVDEAVVEGALAPAPTNAKPAYGDFDGDGCMDIGLKSSDGNWYIDKCSNGFDGAWDHVFFNYGDASATPVPADYDGDGKTDLAIKDAFGMWAIDYAANGFGKFDSQHFGYGNSDGTPVPADYDGDGKADLSVKDVNGFWAIDFAANGFVGWEDQRWGYGGADWIPVPANYDGDVGPGGKPRADRAIKTNAGEWMIDYSSNGYGRRLCYRFMCFTNPWDVERTGYGPADAVPVPADYDQDGFADLAIKDSTHWRIDRQANGYVGWDDQHPFTGGYLTVAIPGNFTPIPPGIVFTDWLDLTVYSFSYGYSLIDVRNTGIGGSWDYQVNNPSRKFVTHSTAPRIIGTSVRGPNGDLVPVNGHYQLRIGQKYTVEVDVGRGPSPGARAGIQFNPALMWPIETSEPAAALTINDWRATTWDVPMPEEQTRRVSIVCSQSGSYPIGFQLFNGSGSFNADHGVRVNCEGPGAGNIVGRVTERVCLPAGSRSCGEPIHNNGHYSVGTEAGLTAIVGATIRITGPGVSMVLPPTDLSGFWGATVPINVPLTIKISKPGYSDTIAVNVRVPGGPSGGLDLFTPLEEEFVALRAKGMLYTTYLDYSRGRTLMHVVTMSTASAMLKNIRATPYQTSPDTRYKSLVTTAREQVGPNWPVIMNAGLFQDKPSTGEPIGYFYSTDNNGYVPSLVPGSCPAETVGEANVCTDDTVPMLTMVGTGLNQQIQIIPDTERAFKTPTIGQWTQTSSSGPLWDRNTDGVSDVDYAVQCGNQDPLYVSSTGEIAAERHPEWASTAIAVAGSAVHLVVVDGEGIWGGNGSSGNQLGTFFRDVLQTTDFIPFTAMLFDSGNSTELVLWGADGRPRHVNTMTGEDNAVQYDPYTQVWANPDGVGNYVKAGGP